MEVVTKYSDGDAVREVEMIVVIMVPVMILAEIYSGDDSDLNCDIMLQIGFLIVLPP